MLFRILSLNLIKIKRRRHRHLPNLLRRYQQLHVHNNRMEVFLVLLQLLHLLNLLLWPLYVLLHLLVAQYVQQHNKIQIQEQHLNKI
ncbi:hypothetical protein pCPXV0123 [Cowpox virus]|uniref:Uncharacterized protein n=1 Tax=Cowpox virus TaxID=10243 RepID=A0A212PNT9_COWPX|nr:hypothetical protein pCPXV0123 [Cowpox virus]SNB50261.1 hypothetical protein pCPXV0123 [Cowpox virus]